MKQSLHDKWINDANMLQTWHSIKKQMSWYGDNSMLILKLVKLIWWNILDLNSVFDWTLKTITLSWSYLIIIANLVW